MRRLIILNAALIALIVVLGLRLRDDWRAFGPAHDLSAIQPKPQTFPALPATSVPSGDADSDWTEIPSKDPFSFDRNDIDIVANEPAQEPAGPKPILFGIMAIANNRTAFVAPGQPGGNRTTRAMRVGETLDGWKIVGIASNSMEIEFNGTRETVILNDPRAQVPRDATKTAGSGVSSSPSVIQPNQSAPIVPSATIPPPPMQGLSTPQAPPPGQQKGRWVQTPFGMKFYPDDPPQQ